MRLPYFPGSRVAWDSSTFLQIDLTNIKHYLYFFFLDFSCMNLSYAFSFFQALEILDGSTLPFFPCKMRNFFRLAWLSSHQLLYFLLFLSFFFLFLFFFHMWWRFLCIFTYSYAFSRRLKVLKVLKVLQVFQEARPLIFHAKHGLKTCMEKPLTLFSTPSPSLFPETTHLPPLFTLSRLNRLPRAYLDALFPSFSDLKLLSSAETSFFCWNSSFPMNLLFWGIRFFADASGFL